MGVSKNRGTPKSSILIGLSIINHPFWGTPIFGNTHIIINLKPLCSPSIRSIHISRQFFFSDPNHLCTVFLNPAVNNQFFNEWK